MADILAEMRQANSAHPLANRPETMESSDIVGEEVSVVGDDDDNDDDKEMSGADAAGAGADAAGAAAGADAGVFEESDSASEFESEQPESESEDEDEPAPAPPVGKSPAGKSPAMKQPAGKSPAGKQPAKKAPAGKQPAGRAPAGKGPSRRPSVKEPISGASMIKIGKSTMKLLFMPKADAEISGLSVADQRAWFSSRGESPSDFFGFAEDAAGAVRAFFRKPTGELCLAKNVGVFDTVYGHLLTPMLMEAVRALPEFDPGCAWLLKDMRAPAFAEFLLDGETPLFPSQLLKSKFEKDASKPKGGRTKRARAEPASPAAPSPASPAKRGRTAAAPPATPTAMPAAATAAAGAPTAMPAAAASGSAAAVLAITNAIGYNLEELKGLLNAMFGVAAPEKKAVAPPPKPQLTDDDIDVIVKQVPEHVNRLMAKVRDAEKAKRPELLKAALVTVFDEFVKLSRGAVPDRAAAGETFYLLTTVDTAIMDTSDETRFVEAVQKLFRAANAGAPKNAAALVKESYPLFVKIRERLDDD